MTINLHGRSLTKEVDLTKEEFTYLVDLAAQLREDKRSGRKEVQKLVGANIALIFEKASTRTRAAFEVAAHDQGAHVTYLGPGESQLGYKESMKDTARVLGRMFDGIEYRGSAQENVEVLARYSGVPVWNGLTERITNPIRRDGAANLRLQGEALRDAQVEMAVKAMSAPIKWLGSDLRKAGRSKRRDLCGRVSGRS